MALCLRQISASSLANFLKSSFGCLKLIFRYENCFSNTVKKLEAISMWTATVPVTVLFYFILKHFGTARLLPSTASVTTSFVAVYLTFRRDPRFSLAYAANDVVLIVLWILASRYDIRYVSVVVCFVAFLVNDIYGFVSWKRMEGRQRGNG